jgi:predicted O-methyltransferase YrrM
MLDLQRCGMMRDCESAAYLGAEADPYPLHLLPQLLHPRRVLEVGPGSGCGTVQLARELPEAEITCLEPDDAARSALAWRLVDRGLLEGRVSVLPMTVEETTSVREADLVVARHVVCQVAATERKAFWSSLAGALAASGVVLVDDHLGAVSSSDVTRRLSAEGRSGRYRVERWFSAVALHAQARHVTNEYVFRDTDGAVVHREERTHEQEVIDVEAELGLVATAGLTRIEHRDGWMVLARRDDEVTA